MNFKILRSVGLCLGMSMCVLIVQVVFDQHARMILITMEVKDRNISVGFWV